MYKLTEKMPQDGQRIFYIVEYDAPVVRIGFFFKLDRQVKADQFLYRKGARYRISGFDPAGRDEKGWAAKETHKGIGETFDNENWSLTEFVTGARVNWTCRFPADLMCSFIVGKSTFITTRFICL